MALTRVLVTVKTYPTLSTKYEELVCTAGFREDGSWVRIYPVPFRKLDYAQQYKKYDWYEFDLERNTSDFRPETYRPRDIDRIGRRIGHLGTDSSWSERKEFVVKKCYRDLDELIRQAKDKTIATSLATFKPAKVLDFDWEPCEREWSESKRKELMQVKLFEQEGTKTNVVKKLPFKFKYFFEDIKGKKSRLMIEDWETGQLYWNCLRKADGDEKRACEKVRQKYFDDFAKTKDLYFFLGTTRQNHFRAPNPFIIIGTFHPKKDHQTSLGF